MTIAPLEHITRGYADELSGFIRTCVSEAGAKGVVVGISGGVDSAVIVKLCADALGGDKVHAVFMPASVTSEVDRRQTEQMCAEWGVDYSVVCIQPAVEAFFGMLLKGGESPLEKGNIMSRCRMITLYHRAKTEGAIVVGTTNRSELLMGYMTKFGDGAEDVMPMCRIYKTQVWELARIIGVPDEIVNKVPTAGLWEGQSDEEEMGITYHDLDLVLNAIEQGASDKEAAELGNVTVEKVQEIRGQIRRMMHKRLPARTPE